MKSFIFLFAVVLSRARVCDKDEVAYTFSDCVNGQRDVIPYWKSKDCSNVPPAVAKQISCDLVCRAGTYLTFKASDNEAECSSCPPNTYATGNKLRFSSKDANWNEFIQGSTRQCAWMNSSQIDTEYCNSFISTKNGSSLTLNSKIFKPNKINFFELKYTKHLKAKGMLKVIYKKKSKQEEGYVNGRISFMLNSNSYPQNNNPLKTDAETNYYELPPGPNEFAWYVYVDTRADAAGISFEFIVLLPIMLGN